MAKKEKCLLIEKLLQDGWFNDEKEALPWVMARQVLVNEEPAASLKVKINKDSKIRIREYYKRKYVNKGGLKLEGALRDFAIDVKGKTALDCGASTGGFTDCLIVHGAEKVYAVDVGHGQLAGKLLINPNVVNLEKTNLSDDVLIGLTPVPSIITLDLSYLSLVKALPICRDIFMGNEGTVICLVKPIYEVPSAEIRRTGDINQKDILHNILFDLCTQFANLGVKILGITNSPVTGNKGTYEYFIAIKINGGAQAINIEEEINIALEKSFELEKFDKNNYK